MEEKLVSFILGPKNSYNAESHKYAIYFATDTKDIFINGGNYGLSTEALAELNAAIAAKIETVEFVSPDTVKFTKGDGTESYFVIPAVTADANGLMTPAQKASLEKVIIDLAAEVTRAKQAEETLQGKLDAETALREGADNTLQDNIDAEANARVVADEALGKRIDQVIADAKTYSVVKLNDEELAALSNANIKEAYKVIDEDKVQCGAVIPIYKDSSLIEVWLDGQTLFYKYLLANGSETQVGVDVSAFLHESEFTNGLQVVDHKVSVKVDATSESFLTVGVDGVKLSGIQTAIETAVAAEKTRAEAAEKANSDAIAKEVQDRAAADTALETAYKQAVKDEYDRAIAEEAKIAQAITDEVDRAKAAEALLQAAIDLLNGDASKAGSVANKIAEAKAIIDAYTVNGKKVSENPILGGADIALTNYAGVTGGNVVATDTVNSAIQKMETRLVWKELN